MPELWPMAKAGTNRGPGHPDLIIIYSAQVRLSHVYADQMSSCVRHALSNHGLLRCDLLIQLLSCESFTLPVHVHAG